MATPLTGLAAASRKHGASPKCSERGTCYRRVSDRNVIEPPTVEHGRMNEYAERHNWRIWGPYVSDRQWGTVREDYSATGEAWDYFPFDVAHKRVYRWGEDGIFGISDVNQHL